jgi:hypothetical protein
METKVEWIFILIFTSISLFYLIFSYFPFYKRHSVLKSRLLKKKRIFENEVSKISTLSRHIKNLESLAPFRNGDPLVIPIFWDKEEGAFMLEIKVGRNWVTLVVDTGSSHMSAKGLNCKWKQCNGDICKEMECPCNEKLRFEQCNNTKFEPSGPQIAIDLNGDGSVTSESKLMYGSQQSLVTHYWEPFEIYQLHLNCEQIVMKSDFDHSRQILEELHPNGLPLLKFGPTIVHLIHEIEGSTTSNIFGLARGTESGDTVLLNSIFGKLAPVWSMFTLAERSGFIAFGSLRCFGEPTYVPLVLPEEFEYFLTKFYIVPVVAVYVDDKKIPESGTPRFLITDTGTTNSYGSSRFGKSLELASWKEGKSTISFVIGDNINNYVLKYTPEDYKDPEGHYLSTINLTKTRTLENFDQIFKGVNVFLMGARLMNNIYWEYDLLNNRLGIIQL